MRNHVACQELFWVALTAISELSSTKTTKEKRKYKKVNKHSKNTERAAHYLADFFAVIARLTLTCQTWFKWQCDRRFNLYHRRFINLSDRRNFDVVGNTHTEAQFSSNNFNFKLYILPDAKISHKTLYLSLFGFYILLILGLSDIWVLYLNLLSLTFLNSTHVCTLLYTYSLEQRD